MLREAMNTACVVLVFLVLLSESMTLSLMKVHCVPSLSDTSKSAFS